MKMGICKWVLAASLTVVFGTWEVVARADNPLKLLPTPKVLKVDGGRIPLVATSRIVAADAKLMSLAEILSQEIRLLTGMRLATAVDEPRPGDIVLKIKPQLRADDEILTVHGQDVVKVRDYAHAISITDRATIEGWDYRSVCEGTATLLQAIVEEGDKYYLPKMTAKDWPFSDFTSIMVDCARQRQPAHVLKIVVDSCRFYKIRYLHLHLHDDSAFTFPSKAYPQANRHNGGIGTYTLEELKDLVAYADARGVTCVPEIEGPGHCGGLLAAMEGKLGKDSERCMDVLNPNIYPILDTLVGEMCEVFKSSPYFHIGGDEVDPAWYMSRPEVKEYMKKNNYGEGDKPMLFLPYAQKMAAIVKKHGKKTLMWEGAPIGPPLHESLAKDVIGYVWYPNPRATRQAQDRGFTTITVPWEIKVPFPQWSMFNCNECILDPKKDKVLGACRPHWEMDHVTLVSWMMGAGERQERTWGPMNQIEADYRENRLAKQNARMKRITQPVKVDFTGNISPNRVFTEPITLALSTPASDLAIRYRFDGGVPDDSSPLFEKPLKVEETVRLRAALFDKDGKRVGNVTVPETRRFLRQLKSLTTGKPVEVSGPRNENEKPEYAVDGVVDIHKFWGTIPAPQWLKVDLKNEFTIDRVQVVPYFDNWRFYQYTVEVSTDGKNWTQVVDATKNAAAGTEKGYLHKFAPTKARYLKVNMLRNSVNPAVHIVEVAAWEVGK